MEIGTHSILSQLLNLDLYFVHLNLKNAELSFEEMHVEEYFHRECQIIL